MWLHFHPRVVPGSKSTIKLKRVTEANKGLILSSFCALCTLVELKSLLIYQLLCLPWGLLTPYSFLVGFALVSFCLCAVFHLVSMVYFWFGSKLEKRREIALMAEPSSGRQLLHSLVGPSVFSRSPYNKNTPSQLPDAISLNSTNTSPYPSTSVYPVSGSPSRPFIAGSLSPVSGISRDTFSPWNFCLSSVAPTSELSDSRRSWSRAQSSPFSFSSSFKSDLSSSSFLATSSDLQKYQYQVSCTPPASQKQNDLDHSSFKPTSPASLTFSTSQLMDPGHVGRDIALELPSHDYWKEHGIDAAILERYIVDLRKWLHGTIFRRLVEEISSLNRHLKESSGENALIGSTSFDTLQQLCATKYQYLPTLPTLLRFLELMKDQGYLVNRLKELARGSCLEDFRWDSGSKSSKLPWKEHLANDSMIVLHMFATYMDARMPPHPNCLTGRVFSQLCVVRHPDKPDLKSKYGAQIYQLSVQPPHFKLVLGGKLYSFQQGPQNLFLAVLMCFHHAFKVDGKFRSVSLGPSGLNVAWIFEGP